MVEFTQREKLALIKVLESVAKADEKLLPQEMDYLVKASQHFHWNPEDIHKSKQLNTKQAGDILRKMEPDKKTVVKNMLMQLANVDGVIHPEELKVILDTFFIKE